MPGAYVKGIDTDADGNEYYTGDAPSCLVDQKNAARFVKYNILLGNLPGNVDYFVSTGGSGGGAHAAMFAATSNNPDFYDYEIDAGAVGVYQTVDEARLGYDLDGNGNATDVVALTIEHDAYNNADTLSPLFNATS